MTPYLDCVDCGHLETGLVCDACASAGMREAALALTRVERKAMSRAHARAEKRRNPGAPGPGQRATALVTDTNWARLGTVEPGYNGGRPLESRADFERERKAKGHEIVTLRELKNPRRRNPEQEMEQKIHALAEKYQRA